MLFSKDARKAYTWFSELICQNAYVFGEAIKEKCGQITEGCLSDEEFVDCYLAGMKSLTKVLVCKVRTELAKDSQAWQRFENALENPSLLGFRFSNGDITIGKIYLSYVWGCHKKKASKSDCIRLEKLAVSLIAEQCRDCGLVS